MSCFGFGECARVVARIAGFIRFVGFLYLTLLICEVKWFIWSLVGFPYCIFCLELGSLAG